MCWTKILNLRECWKQLQKLKVQKRGRFRVKRMLDFGLFNNNNNMS